MLEDYRLVHRFRVPFADVDMLQHVNNTSYLIWAEHLRTEYFSEVLGESIGGSTGMILGKTEIVYEVPLGYHERVAMGARVIRIGTKSFVFAHEVWSEDRSVRCARLESTMVAFDYVTNKTIAVPERWRDRVAEYEPVPAAR